MRNFGNESYVSPHQHQQQQLYYHHFHHQLAGLNPPPLPPLHLATMPPAVKMEPYPLTKTIGVGVLPSTNLKLPTKSHFSPVNVVATTPSPHDPHYSSSGSGHNHSSNGNSNNNNSNNGSGNNAPVNSTNNNVVTGIPINLSHHHHLHQSHLPGTLVSSSTTSTASPNSESHLPTAAIAATCPTTGNNREPSPPHQQIPVNGSPYQPSHSPALPVANTPLPTEMHSSSGTKAPFSNRSSPTTGQINPGTDAKVPYHLATTITSFNKIQHHNNILNSRISKSSATEGANERVITSHSPNPSHPLTTSLNPSHHGPSGISAPVKSETNPSHPPTTTVPNNTSVVGGGSNANSPMNGGGSSSPNGSSGSSATSTSAASTTARIVSQNVNGTLAITGIPSNESELQLFRVLQRANLLTYFDVMIELGGDDVQQLCEAGEEEFLEIMALIGMAAKPLHVRRLQKALQEWMTQPSLFQSPVLPPGYQHHYGVSQIEHTISHTQYTATSNVPGGIGHHHQHQPVPVIPLPHLVSHNLVSPYPAQNAPTAYGIESIVNSNPVESSSSSSSSFSKADSLNTNAKPYSQDRSNNNSSPSLANSMTTTGTAVGGLHGPYLQQGSPLIPVVISTNAQPTYNSGQTHHITGNLSSTTTSTGAGDSYRNCISPSGSTSSSSSTVSIRSHHHQFHPHQNYPSSPMENSPGSPANSESSGRSGYSISKNKPEEPTTSTELENASSSDQTNSIQSHDNSAGTQIVARVAAVSRGGSEPSSPAPPTISSSSFLKGAMLISSSQAADSPRPSSESVTNRNNNSVTFPSSSLQTIDFSLQEHEIQKLAETAMNLVRSLPSNVKEPKLSRKIETSSYEFILRLTDDDPRRMEEIRKISTIFGKAGNGDTATPSSKKSKHSHNSSNSSTKPVSILELAMNEAAAQLCSLVPALLTKRDEMYNLARQIIRESGLPYAVICANSNLPSSFLHTNGVNNNNNEVGKGKIDDIRNSPAHEDRISHEFAAACKKIKLDIRGADTQEFNGYSGSRKHSLTQTSDNGMHITEIPNFPRRKSPSRDRESNIVTATALKRMALAAEFRNPSNKNASLPIRT